MNNQIEVHVNDIKITLNQENVSGIDLKKSTSIPENEKLYLEIENAPDTEVINNNIYEIKSGMKFFSGTYCRKVLVNIDHTKYDLQKSDCTGQELKAKASIPTAFKLVKETNNGDISIEDNVVYHFEKGDILFSVPDGINNGSDDVELLSFDKEILEESGYKYEIHQSSNEKILIINDYLISSMFDQEKIKVLIKIPNGYPMAKLDMFWVYPYVKLKDTKEYPKNADVFENIEGKEWQRFSRHYTWKPIYNLGTHLAVVKDVLVNGRG